MTNEEPTLEKNEKKLHAMQTAITKGLESGISDKSMTEIRNKARKQAQDRGV